MLTEATEETSQDFLKAVMRGFHGEFSEHSWDLDRRLFEADRCFGFTAGDRWVATCGAFTRTMTTPGGSGSASGPDQNGWSSGAASMATPASRVR